MKYLLLLILVIGSFSSFSQDANEKVLKTLYKSHDAFVKVRKQANVEIKRLKKMIKELEPTQAPLEVTGHIQNIKYHFSGVSTDTIFTQCVVFVSKHSSKLRNILEELRHQLYVDQMAIYLNGNWVRSLSWYYGTSANSICTNLKKSVEAYIK